MAFTTDTVVSGLAAAACGFELVQLEFVSTPAVSVARIRPAHTVANSPPNPLDVARGDTTRELNASGWRPNTKSFLIKFRNLFLETPEISDTLATFVFPSCT
jgi:hypothetical protein